MLPRSKHLIQAVTLAGAAATGLQEGGVLFKTLWEFDWRDSGLISSDQSVVRTPDGPGQTWILADPSS